MGRGLQEAGHISATMSSGLSRMLLDNAYLVAPSGGGGTAFDSKDLSFVPQVDHDLAVRRWTRYQTSLRLWHPQIETMMTLSRFTSEIEIMMPLTSEHGSGLKEMIYVKIS